MSLTLWQKLTQDETINSLELWFINYETFEIRSFGIIRNRLPKAETRWLYASNGEDFILRDSVTFLTREEARQSALEFCLQNSSTPNCLAFLERYGLETFEPYKPIPEDTPLNRLILAMHFYATRINAIEAHHCIGAECPVCHHGKIAEGIRAEIRLFREWQHTVDDGFLDFFDMRTPAPPHRPRGMTDECPSMFRMEEVIKGGTWTEIERAHVATCGHCTHMMTLWRQSS